jgi:hypothetical protein
MIKMNLRIIFVLVLLSVLMTGVMAQSEVSSSKDITLNDGTKLVQYSSKNLKVGDFEVTSSVDMHDIGDIVETKEWGYDLPGFDVISSGKDLEIINDEYVCLSENTKREIVASANGVIIEKVSNPTCIYYPKQVSITGSDDLTNANLVTLRQLNEKTIRVDYPFNNYDPEYVNYTGNCSSAGGCTIYAEKYTADITYGAIQNLKATGSDNPNLDWCQGGSTSSCSAIYASSWRMDANITATCTPVNYSDYVYMNCSNSEAEQHFFFYKTYIKTEITAKNNAYRYYWYTTIPAKNGTAYNDTAPLAPSVRWGDSVSPNGIMGIAANTSVASSEYNTSYILAVVWNESIKTACDYAAGSDTSGLALFRGDEVPANTWMTTYIKFLQRNESQSNSVMKYTDVLKAFKANPLFGDSASPSNLSISFISPTPSNGSSQSSSNIYVNTSISSANNTSGVIDFNDEVQLWLNFENISGTTVYDFSTYGRDGTSYNSPTQVTGKFGKGILFNGKNDGTNKYVRVNHASAFNTLPLSVELFVKFDAFSSEMGSEQILAMKQNNVSPWSSWALSLASNNTFRWKVINSSSQVTNIYANANISKGVWYHVVGTIDENGNMKLYVNGVLQSDTKTCNNMYQSNYQLRIGSDSSSNSGANATIDEVRVRNIVLSSEEINASYNALINRLYHDFTGLDDGTYSIRAHVIDENGSIASTEIRSITISSNGSSIANEAQGRTAINTGINGELQSPTIDDDVVVYVVYQNGTHKVGTYDKFASQNSKRWAFNYLTGSDSLQSLSPLQVLFFWENSSLTTAQIESQVDSLIAATK